MSGGGGRGGGVKINAKVCETVVRARDLRKPLFLTQVSLPSVFQWRLTL